MFTATAGLVLPTTVTGSWPRPSWYQAALRGEPLSAKMNDLQFREEFTDATQIVLSDQDRAGLDILTNGDYHHDPDFAGRSWLMYPLERLDGTAKIPLESAANIKTSRPGTISNEIFRDWRFPAVVDKIREGVPLEYPRIWQIAHERTTKPVKFGAISAQGLARFATLRTDKYAPDKRELLWDIAGIMNAELRQLATAGCKVIQIEEPSLHFVATQGADKGYLDFLVDCLNREIEGLTDVEVWLHTCWGNPAMQRSHQNTDYADVVELFMERVNGDVWTIESKDNRYSPLPLFERYKNDFPNKKVAVGVASHRSVQVETDEEVADEIRNALKYIPAENLVLSTDCGFGRQGLNRLVAYYKAAAIVAGAALIRDELGIPAVSG